MDLFGNDLQLGEPGLEGLTVIIGGRAEAGLVDVEPVLGEQGVAMPGASCALNFSM